MTILFGGECWPIGWKVGFLERPYAEVIEAMRHWDTVERWTATELPPSTIKERLLRLAPLQTPPKRELVIPAGERWTAHLMNSLLGGDSVSWVGHLSQVLECQGVIASHIPIGQYPYPSTQFELLRPDGPPPRHYVRTITAGIYDSGRWSFMVSGDPQPFEEPDSYLQRRKRDRFTRPMLTRYLAALGVEADDVTIYGQAGSLFESLSDYAPRTMTLAEARADYTRG